uniref:Uncharacterized protein n=1 Tax=Leersia perrieri TaxID=77586 RepID=A0A0D9VFT6_9ORYZ
MQVHRLQTPSSSVWQPRRAAAPPAAAPPTEPLHSPRRRLVVYSSPAKPLPPICGGARDLVTERRYSSSFRLPRTDSGGRRPYLVPDFLLVSSEIKESIVPQTVLISK